MPLNHPITPALLADPEIFQQNRLPFHAHFADQTSPELPLTVSLDGEWNFRYAENLTAPFTDWDTLTVPGFIQMQSLQKPGQPYGTPHYVNTQYPWDGHEKLHPGQIPQDYNPIGEYQRSFTLPESWASCYLRLNGADSAAAVWCNGVYIGYTEDTFTPAEFDMTAAVHPGENTLTVQVYRFSSGSWLEDQDFWRMSGLFRSVELFTKPEIHLEDVFVKQSFADDFSSATVTFDCKVSGAGTVSVVFNGQQQSAEVGEPAEYDSGVVFGKGEADPDVEEDVQDVSFTFAVTDPALWSAEQPNLYEAEIALLPQPFVTSVLTQNSDVRVALDLTEEWDKAVEGQSGLTMGCVVVRSEFAENNKEALDSFLDEYKASVETVTSEEGLSHAAELSEKYDIMKAAVAQQAILECNIVFVEGDEMQQIASGFLQVLYDANPQSVGGNLPNEDFYYKR